MVACAKIGECVDKNANSIIKLANTGILPLARTVWDFWKITRDQEFIEWFEREIYGEGSELDYKRSETDYTGFSKSIR